MTKTKNTESRKLESSKHEKKISKFRDENMFYLHAISQLLSQKWNFEFWSLGFICYLGFVIWDFKRTNLVPIARSAHVS